MSTTNNDEDPSSGSPGTASVQDELDNWFTDRQRRTEKDASRHFQVFKAVNYVLLRSLDCNLGALSKQEIIAEIGLTDHDLARDPNLGNYVSDTLDIGFWLNDGLKLFQSYIRYDVKYYLAGISSELGHAINSMTTAFLNAFKESQFTSFVNITMFSKLKKYPELTKYHSTLLFTLFRHDKIWPEELNRSYFHFVISQSETSYLALAIVISYLIELGHVHKTFHVLLSQCIVHFVKVLQQSGFSLYRSSNNSRTNSNLKIIAMESCELRGLNEKDYIKEKVRMLMVQVLTQHTKEHPEKSVYFQEKDFITEIVRVSPELEFIPNLKETVSDILEEDSSGDDFYAILTLSNNQYYLDQKKFSIEQAENLVLMCNRFFNAYDLKKMDHTINLNDMELLEKYPTLAKYYISHISTVFGHSNKPTEDFHLCYVKTIFWEIEIHPESTELLISHLFILAEVDSMFLKALERYVVLIFKPFHQSGITIYFNTKDILSSPRTP